MNEKSSDKEQFGYIEENLKRMRERIANAALRAGRRPEEVRLMAVTKHVEPAAINCAIACGVDLIGENRVQEFLGKREQLRLEHCEAHMIGHLQTNKIGDILGQVDCIQSVDSLRLAQELSKRAAAKDQRCNILLEVNAGAEESKFGFSPENLEEVLCEIAAYPGICIQGLMTVAPIFTENRPVHPFFSIMQQLFLDISEKKLDNINMDILSMGMSDDFEEAVAAGSTLVRLGSAIFGMRRY